jgi:hypothetical protein
MAPHPNANRDKKNEQAGTPHSGLEAKGEDNGSDYKYE